MTKNSDKEYAIGLALLQFEAGCYFRYAMLLTELFMKQKPDAKYGEANGFDSFIGLSSNLDMSVYLYEALEFIKTINPDSNENAGLKQFMNDLKVVRNNIHTYSRSGGFDRKAKEIVRSKLEEYEMLEPDILYPLRNDISLVYHIDGGEHKLIGSDQFIQHCIFESDNKAWTGENYKEYAENLGSMIAGLAEAFDQVAYRLTELVPAGNLPQIELFDYKSADLFDRVDVGDTIAFRLMLILSQLSFGLLLVNDLIDESVIVKSELWELFLTKLLAIKYDESYDNIQSMLQHADSKDRTAIGALLNEHRINMDELQTRVFAQKLRNTIHYQRVSLDATLCADRTTASWIKGIYFTNSGTKSMDEFRVKKEIMIRDMQRLQTAIQAFFCLNKRSFQA